MKCKTLIYIVVYSLILIIMGYLFMEGQTQVFGTICIKKKINELQWRIEDLEQLLGEQ